MSPAARLCLLTAAAAFLAAGATLAEAARAGAAGSPDVWVCYSRFQLVPAPMPLAEATALGDQPHEPGRLELGAYDLSCGNDLSGSWADTETSLGGGGEVYDPLATFAYRNAGPEGLGIYPILAPAPALFGSSNCSCSAPQVPLGGGDGWRGLELVPVAARLVPQRWPQRQRTDAGSGYTFALYGSRRGAAQLLRALAERGSRTDVERLLVGFDFRRAVLGVVFVSASASSFGVVALSRSGTEVTAHVERHVPALVVGPAQPFVSAELIRVDRRRLGGRLPREAKVVERVVVDG